MNESTTLNDFYPTREKVEADIDGVNVNWRRTLLEWDDRLDCQLREGEIIDAEVDEKVALYKEAFFSAIMSGSELSDEEAVPHLIEGALWYSWDHDGGKIPYICAVNAYMIRKFLIENGRYPEFEDLNWQDDEATIEHYVKGGFKRFQEMEEDFGLPSAERAEVLPFVWTEFLGKEDANAAAALAYGTYINLFVHWEYD